MDRQHKVGAKESTVCVVGANGWLGQKIARALDAQGARLVLGLRGGASHSQANQFDELVGRGARLVHADLTRPETLAPLLEGVDVVVSAVQGGPDVVVKGQTTLAEAALDAGVSRMVPSDFCIDHRQVGLEQNLFLAMRRQANEAIRELGLPQTNVFSGAFLDLLGMSLHEDPFFGLVDWRAWEVCAWGDPDQPYDFTLTDDIATVTAHIALDKDVPDGAFNLVANRVSPRQLAEEMQRVSGREVGLRILGGMGDLLDEIARRQAASPQDPLQWAGLQFHSLMASGSCVVGPSQHERYEVSPVDLGSWLEHALERDR